MDDPAASAQRGVHPGRGADFGGSQGRSSVTAKAVWPYAVSTATAEGRDRVCIYLVKTMPPSTAMV
jgi:glutamate dehydrogenase/leucine dehydrogenase